MLAYIPYMDPMGYRYQPTFMVNQLTPGRPSHRTVMARKATRARQATCSSPMVHGDSMGHSEGYTMEIQKKQCVMVDNVYIYIYIRII